MADEIKTAKDGTNEIGNREDGNKASWQELQITMDKRVDLAVSVFIVIFGAFMVIAARNIRAGFIPDPITSRGTPTLTGLSLVIVGIFLAARRLLTWSELPGNLVPEEGQEDEKGYSSSWFRAIAIILVSLLWEWLLRPLGFLLITPLYLLASSLIMGVQSWRSTIAFSIIFTLSTWFIFGPLLGVRFPLGPLYPLAQSLGLIW